MQAVGFTEIHQWLLNQESTMVRLNDKILRSNREVPGNVRVHLHLQDRGWDLGIGHEIHDQRSPKVGDSDILAFPLVNQ